MDPPHVLNVEECGSPHGVPVVFLHGGPGAGCEPYHRQFFDPEAYRIVLFDQRGSGRSTPHAEIDGNTTPALVADMERIRAHLGIERWVVFGGSWGAALALVYAETHPERVLGLILRGVFWAGLRTSAGYIGGASRVFPDYWADFVHPIPAAERGTCCAPSIGVSWAMTRWRVWRPKAWALWEARISSLRTRPETIGYFSQPYTALSLARLEVHYFVNDCFLNPTRSWTPRASRPSGNHRTRPLRYGLPPG
jgi:proline iminopeptidase